MSQAFHVAPFERFTDPNLLKPFKICIQYHSKLGNTGFTVLFSLAVVMVRGDQSSQLRSWLTFLWFWPAAGPYWQPRWSDEDFVFAVFFIVSGLFAADGTENFYSDRSVKVEVNNPDTAASKLHLLCNASHITCIAFANAGEFHRIFTLRVSF